MLGKQGIIEEHEAEKIVEGLKGILKDIEDGNVEFSLDYEDIHMNVEAAADRAHRRHGQAPAYRPFEKRSGRARYAYVCQEGDHARSSR